MKILHVLETSLPNTVGYTVRANAIITQQRRMGLDPVVITSPFFVTENKNLRTEEIDGIRYYRTNHIPTPSSARSKLLSYGVRLQMLRRYRRAVMEVAKTERPDVIHAHSSYTNAYGALPTARKLGIPLVYEVRTLWGESAVIESGWQSGSLKHRLIWRLELGAMKQADLVIPISLGIFDELSRRGISPDKLRIVPNGVDTTRFTPLARNHIQAKKVGFADRFVVGFVGSVLRLEGLATLIDAYAICRAQQKNLGLLIVGDGPERKTLEARVAQLGLTDVVFTGRVPHEDVAAWYSVMDVLVYPRIRAVINERVTPLKPLEAMAQGKVCIGSNVGGLLELIRHDETGLVFESENPISLADCISSLVDDPDRMGRLRDAALSFVKTEREWSTIVARYTPLYSGLIQRQ
jgi:PEP-CTERM/exosortase A-associated glycosyltransferase